MRKKKKKNRNKSCNSNTKSNVSRYFDKAISLISLLLTIASLGIAIVSFNLSKNALDISQCALKISEKEYLLSSNDLIPNIDFDINEDRTKITIKNNSSDLFNVENIQVLGVRVYGFEDRTLSREIQIPIIDLSKLEMIDKDKRNNDTINVNFSEAFLVGYGVHNNKDIGEAINKKLEEEYNLNSSKGYTIPSLNTYYYVITIDYSDKFNNFKSIHYKYVHLHGVGEFKKIKIDEKEVNKIVDLCNLPNHKSFEELWNDLLKNKKYYREFRD